MFDTIKHVLVCIAVVIINSKTCTTEPPPPSLVLYSPGDLEYTDVLVRRARDNLTLICELRGDTAPRVFVWNYVGGNATAAGRPFTVDPGSGPSSHSKLERAALQAGDSGHYMCSAPPFSVTKYVIVQPQGFVEMDYPPLVERPHADYGFIQNTIYTVTACALIFMIAVLAVSPLCKTRMTRAALRDYARAHHATAHHYSPFASESAKDITPGTKILDVGSPECPNSGFGLARLSAIFSSRYRQVPTQCDVEKTDVCPSLLTSSPIRHRTLDFVRLKSNETYTLNGLTIKVLGAALPPPHTESMRSKVYGPPRENLSREGLNRDVSPNTAEEARNNVEMPPNYEDLASGVDANANGNVGFGAPINNITVTDNGHNNTTSMIHSFLNGNKFDSNITTVYSAISNNVTYNGTIELNRTVGAIDNNNDPNTNDDLNSNVLYFLSSEALNRDVRPNTADEEARINVEMPPNYEDLASGVDANANGNVRSGPVINNVTITYNGNNNLTKFFHSFNVNCTGSNCNRSDSNFTTVYYAIPNNVTYNGTVELNRTVVAINDNNDPNTNDDLNSNVPYLSREGLNRDVSPNTADEARNNVEMPPNYEDLASGVDTNANGNVRSGPVVNNLTITNNGNNNTVNIIRSFNVNCTGSYCNRSVSNVTTVYNAISNVGFVADVHTRTITNNGDNKTVDIINRYNV